MSALISASMVPLSLGIFAICLEKNSKFYNLHLHLVRFFKGRINSVNPILSSKTLNSDEVKLKLNSLIAYKLDAYDFV